MLKSSQNHSEAREHVYCHRTSIRILSTYKMNINESILFNVDSVPCLLLTSLNNTTSVTASHPGCRIGSENVKIRCSVVQSHRQIRSVILSVISKSEHRDIIQTSTPSPQNLRCDREGVGTPTLNNCFTFSFKWTG